MLHTQDTTLAEHRKVAAATFSGEEDQLPSQRHAAFSDAASSQQEPGQTGSATQAALAEHVQDVAQAAGASAGGTAASTSAAADPAAEEQAQDIGPFEPETMNALAAGDTKPQAQVSHCAELLD